MNHLNNEPKVMVDQNFKTYFLLQKSCKIAVLTAVALEKLTD